MAQTGYTPILIYSSSTTTNVPSASNLTNSTLGSELAINITDGKLFYKDNANAVQVIAWKTTPTTAGGTGLTSYTAGDLLYYATGTTLSKLAIGVSKTILTSSGTAPQWSTSLDTTQGGTGLTAYTAGDLPYFATGTALSKLAIGANTYVLTSSGTAPQWTAPSSVAIGTATNLAGGVAGSVPYQSGAGATTFVSIGSAYQALQVNAGGTAPSWQASSTSTLTTQGDLLYASAANTLARLAKNTTATRYLANTGTSNNPAWAQVDMTNGVTGTLPVGNGGTGIATLSTGRIPFGNNTSAFGSSAKLIWDSSNERLGLNTASPGFLFHVTGISQLQKVQYWGASDPNTPRGLTWCENVALTWTNGSTYDFNFTTTTDDPVALRCAMTLYRTAPAVDYREVIITFHANAGVGSSTTTTITTVGSGASIGIAVSYVSGTTYKITFTNNYGITVYYPSVRIDAFGLQIGF